MLCQISHVTSAPALLMTLTLLFRVRCQKLRAAAASVATRSTPGSGVCA
ncbi:hypothetical protein PF011_g32388 [Phytophthora fragariae]|uniref:Uncharacterized protein n=1 Tax=Phytophthora fragariae TaxID=53985 RepID=A0A6A3G9H1_9STRA|nr:hypothetical protein PF011_g32388 [Phytophthora fragariae]